MKLVVNVARRSELLSCGHESPYCMVNPLGDATASIEIAGMVLPPTGGVIMVSDVGRISNGVFEGSRYELQFFLPPAPRYTGPKAPPRGPMKENGNDGGSGSSGAGGSDGSGAGNSGGGKMVPAWVSQVMEHTDKLPQFKDK